ncbi:MAG: hypothetical protein HKN41_05440 [Ilumatobacter sp.]|nr:hypothetical protein [Ilumatobacter sp.]
MRTARALAVALLAPIGLATTDPEPAPADASAPEPAVESELVEWALERFHAAGLELPNDIVVSFHGDDQPCEGNHGTYRPGEPDRVRICRHDPDPEIQDQLRRHALLHELAHAWTDHELERDRRDAFLELRGATTWSNREVAWHDRGTEQAAEIITWGLLDREVGFLNIRDTRCDQLRAGYVTLTGVEPTAGLEHSCS